ncbi:MAG: helix-turn-helix domain-containing protein, partial [Kurthia sp.]
MSSQKMSKGDLTKQRILDVARNLFYKQGYDSTSTAQIAKESNISDAAMYKYFKGKSALLIASVVPTVLFER